MAHERALGGGPRGSSPARAGSVGATLHALGRLGPLTNASGPRHNPPRHALPTSILFAVCDDHAGAKSQLAERDGRKRPRHAGASPPTRQPPSAKLDLSMAQPCTS